MEEYHGTLTSPSPLLCPPPEIFLLAAPHGKENKDTETARELIPHQEQVAPRTLFARLRSASPLSQPHPPPYSQPVVPHHSPRRGRTHAL